jgi:hypothetical protein
LANDKWRGEEFVGLKIGVRKELEISSRGNPPRPTNSLTAAKRRKIEGEIWFLQRGALLKEPVGQISDIPMKFPEEDMAFIGTPDRLLGA